MWSHDDVTDSLETQSEVEIKCAKFYTCMSSSFGGVKKDWEANRIALYSRERLKKGSNVYLSIVYFTHFVFVELYHFWTIQCKNQSTVNGQPIFWKLIFMTLEPMLQTVWHPALFDKLISAGLFSCFARWTQSFLSDRRACVVYQNHKSRFFRIGWCFPQGSVLGPVLFSLFINDLPASLPSSVSCSLYANDLAILSFSPSVPTAVEAIQGAKFRLEGWSEYWCLPFNLSKWEASFFSVGPSKANLIPTSFYSTPASVSIPLQLFLGSPSTALFPFLNMYLRWKPSFSLALRPYAVSLLPHGAPLRSPSLFGPFSHMRHPDGSLS